jgi:hypothetical protein
LQYFSIFVKPGDLTGGIDVGESREGEGGARRATTANIAMCIREELEQDGREPLQIQVFEITETLFAVSVFEVGSSVPEQFFFSLREEERQ